MSKKNYTSNIRQILTSFMGTILAVCILVIYKAGKAAYDFGFRIFTEEPMSSAPGRDVAVTVVQGDSLMDTCEMLEEKGLVHDAKLTWIQKKVSVYDNDVQPGFYTLNTSMTADEMFAVIAGKSDDEESEEEGEGDIVTKEAAPLTEGDVDMDSLIDSTIPDDTYHDPFDPFGEDGEGAEGESAEGAEGEGAEDAGE